LATKVGIVGHRGYSGAELVRILQHHPGVEPLLLEHRDDHAHRSPIRNPKTPATIPSTREAVQDAGVALVFLATPPEVSMELAGTMLDAGALRVLEGSSLVGFHVTSVLPTGMLAVRSGTTMSEAHSLRITLSGPGGHGAMPSATGNVIAAVADLVGQLSGVTEGLHYEDVNCVCSAGTLQAGTAVNVVPTSARITGTLRTFTDAQRETALERLRALCAALAVSHEVTIELELPERTPAVVNDGAVTDLVEREARAGLGADHLVFRMPPSAPSDDVSEFLRHLPGCYFFVGGAAADGSSGMHHSPRFFVEDGSLRVGASVMVRSALALAAP